MSRFPTPKKAFVRGAWIVYWNHNYQRYQVNLGVREKDEEELAEAERRQIAASLATTAGAPVFADDFANSPGVLRYLKDRYGVEPESAEPVGEWLRDYEPHILQEVTESWARPSLSMLKRLDAFTRGKIESTTPDLAQAFLDSLLKQGLKPARRNRALIMCNRFFKWAMRTKRAKENPFFGIRLMKEERSQDILHCTKAEREAIIRLAKTSGEPDWLAVPLALYAGLRREEVYRQVWEDVDLESGRITVRISKNKRLRRIPIYSKLAKLLAAVPEDRRRGAVAVMARKDISKTNRAQRLVVLIRQKAKAGGTPITESKIAWNVFRHTFGSLLAQEGVSLDKITAWMGNTPEVCRRHYAQFTPLDRKDRDIERM